MSLGTALASVPAKMERPVDRDGHVARTQLIKRLMDVPDDVPLVLLTAPAGYGKTTVLSQWSAADDREFAWVTLDEADADPVRLAGHIALALHQIEPLQPSVFRALSAGEGPRHVAALAPLLTSLRSWTRPAVLVLDDVHELQNVQGTNFIRALAGGLPRSFHIAIGSRWALSLGRLRSENRCVELGPADLALGEPEARVVLEAAGAPCSDETVRVLVRRTEGWAAGIYLAALAMQATPEVAEAPTEIVGDDLFIVDYFRDELLAQESPETVRFLLRTSVLDQLSGSLCDAVLRQSGSATQLADAARRNLFVVPLDRRGEWYRYHHLVGEMLRSELRRREPDEELRVHRRAAEWYAGRDLPEEAIVHAIAGRDIVSAAVLVNRHARAFTSMGRLHTVRGWLDALGEQGLNSYPPLAVTAAWLSALSGDPARAQRCLHLAGNASFDGPLPDGSSSLASAIVLLRAVMGSLGVERMLVDAAAAVELEPPGSPWHPAAMSSLGIAHALSGALDTARKELELAAHLGQEEQRPAAATSLAQLSLVAAELDDWPAAEQAAREAIDLVRAGGLQDQLLSVLTFSAAARAAAHGHDHEAARRHVGSALRLYADPSPAALPWLSAQVAITLGHIFLDLDDVAAARFRADEARGHLSRLLTEGCLREQLDRLAAGIAHRREQARAPGAMALSTAEMRVLQLLPTHLTLGEIGDELHTSRNTVKTHVAAVYRKLDCTVRTEAVRRGRDLGLLQT